jgi:very-short-patch-repair endonuclease
MSVLSIKTRLSSGIDRLIDDACAEKAHSLRKRWTDETFFSSQGITSPIERLFFMAFTELGPSGRPSSIPPRSQLIEPQEGMVILQTQAIVFDGWPIDFCIVASSKGRAFKAAIECDGYEFHERTKEQASRDRSRDRKLQELGFRVFRFTGSELHRDPFKCAVEVHLAIHEFMKSAKGL